MSMAVAVVAGEKPLADMNGLINNRRKYERNTKQRKRCVLCRLGTVR